MVRVLEARGPRSKCQPGWFLSEAVRMNLAHASVLASGEWLGFFGVLGP